jgi:lantibiotic modifying enzyme
MLLALALASACTAQPPRRAAVPRVEVESLHASWRGAGEWLLANGVERAPGRIWAADPRQVETVSNGLYGGYAGVVLFLLEGAAVEHDARWRAAGEAGADHLAAQVEVENDPGLYTGLLGMAFVLERAAHLTGNDRYRAAATRAVERVIAMAHPIGAGVDWGPVKPDPENPPANDVVAGAAGIGLGLLWAQDALHVPGARVTAVLAARRLIEIALPASPGGAGRKWELVPGFERLYPNFAHGTAGVAYFLATLYEGTRDVAFLDAARAGARYLQSIATPTARGCLVFRHEPDAKDLFYYSWCHGPAGTSRLFYRLYRITGEPIWKEWFDKLAFGVLDSGIPETRQPGFWNVSQCCGSAGVAEYALALYRLDHRADELDLARRMTADLLAHATVEGGGRKWIQAENRTDPDHVVAQTGYMQGASGIGMWLLRFDLFERGRELDLTLPDSPF